MFRVGIVTNKGRIEAQNFDTREQADDYILSFDKEETVTHFRIEQDGKLLEIEKGKF